MDAAMRKRDDHKKISCLAIRVEPTGTTVAIRASGAGRKPILSYSKNPLQVGARASSLTKSGLPNDEVTCCFLTSCDCWTTEPRLGHRMRSALGVRWNTISRQLNRRIRGYQE